MNKLYCILISVCLSFSALAQGPNWHWAKSGGGAGADVATNIGTDENGNIYVLGIYRDNPSFDGHTVTNSQAAYVLTKYNAGGGFISAKKLDVDINWQSFSRFDGHGNLYFAGIADNTVSIAGSIHSPYNGGLLLVKYSSAGDFLWERQDGNAGGTFVYVDNSFAVDADGNAYIHSGHNGRVIFGTDTLTATAADAAFTVKYDANGVLKWVKRTSSGGSANFGSAVAVDRQRNIYVAGVYEGSLVVGTQTLTPVDTSYRSCYLAKYDSTGTVIWVRKFGANRNSFGPSALTCDPQGNVLISMAGNALFGQVALAPAAASHGGLGLFKCDSSGQLLWGKFRNGYDFFTSGGYAPAEIITDLAGNIYLTSQYGHYDKQKDTAAFDNITLYTNTRYNYYLAKLSPAGQTVWAYNLDSIDRFTSSNLCINTAGEIFLTGYFSTSAWLGNNILTSQGNSDMFFSKLSNTPAAIKPLKEDTDSLTIYPNPADGVVMVAGNSNDYTQVLIIDPLGKVAYQQALLPGKAVSILSLSKLQAGLYYAQFTGKSGRALIRKLVLQR